MALTEYHKKRNLNKTPEPAAGQSSGNQLSFVIQKHKASHLHYDFRLELKGVLKSWAVPKGPSTDPEVRRSGFLVEDHPFDYKDFEGNIPKGNYGAGSVIIWDQGTYEPVEKATTKKEKESKLSGQFYKGEMDIILKGKKLKGRFKLVKMKGDDDKQWLLIKVKDRYAAKADVTKQDKSVVSGLTIEQMKTNTEAEIWKSNRHADGTLKNDDEESGVKQLLKDARKTPMPQKISPMKAELVREPFDNDEWIYELKFDGYRIISFLKEDNVTLHTKASMNVSKKYAVVTEALQQLQLNAVLDGEIVAVNEKGLPDFQALGRYKNDAPLLYYVFDILWLDGYDLTHLPLEQRREILRQVLQTNDVIKFSEEFESGIELFNQVQQIGLEGIIAKRKDSIYVQQRKKTWQKIKSDAIVDVVLAGWTESSERKSFRSLLFGYYEDAKLKFLGHVGHGFDDKTRKLVEIELKSLESKKNYFTTAVDHSTTPHWLKPERVIRIRIDDITAAGKIRKPATFLGFRDDMDPKEVSDPSPELKTIHGTKAAEQKSKAASAVTKQSKTTTSKAKTNEDSNWPTLDKQPVTRRDIVGIEENELELTNLDKEYWGELTKGDLINYYIRIAPFILPHLQNRPLSLHIKHIAPAAPGLYIKDMEGREPSYAAIHTTLRKHKKKGKRDVIDYLVCNNLSTLVYAVNLGCIDLNPWTSTTENEHQPDFIIIDLDPSDNDFKKAITTALASKEFFDKHKLKSFIKTSGKTGIHLFLPCNSFNFTQARTIAENICSGIHELVPSITTTNVSVSSRGNKLYLDPNQNDYADTVASAYSARPHGKPTVSAPIEWKEVKDNLSLDSFTIQSIEKRLEKKGDLFIGVYNKKVAANNTKQLNKFL